ncbi:MAG: hypothetical protein IPL47_08090 [Phyllobacteriaceae bacterium]|nr:hypothetical protein [Phyllobacteriaceae bacterium]
MVTAMAISQRLLAIVMLVAMTAILPEMLSGNTTAPVLFRPDAFIFFSFAYGLPILVIREWAIRLGLGKGGVFLAGMAYGLINEGLLAKTIFRESGVPIDLFDHYGFAFGVNFPWALFICVWHALSSVLFPIALAQHFAGPVGALPWLGKWTAFVLAALAVALASVFFLNDETTGARGEPAILASLWATMAVLAFAASRLRATPAFSPSDGLWKPWAFGLAGLPLMIALLLFARFDAPAPVYLAAFAAIAAFWVWFIHRQGWFGQPAFCRVALGWYTQMVGFSWFSMIHRSPVTIAVGVVALALIHWLNLRAERRIAP